MAFVQLQRIYHRLRRVLRGLRRARSARPPDPRVDADPWLAKMLDELGERYRLGKDVPDGIQVLRRTARTRFNPMRVYLRPSNRAVIGDYDVRLREGKTIAEGRGLLDRKVGARLSELGLRPSKEAIEEWGGLVIVRRYEGLCQDAHRAASAVRFMCEESEQVIDAVAE
jgi:hypothetical protein